MAPQATLSLSREWRERFLSRHLSLSNPLNRVLFSLFFLNVGWNHERQCGVTLHVYFMKRALCTIVSFSYYTCRCLILDESEREKLEKISSRIIAIPGGLNFLLGASNKTPTIFKKCSCSAARWWMEWNSTSLIMCIVSLEMYSFNLVSRFHSLKFFFWFFGSKLVHQFKMT